MKTYKRTNRKQQRLEERRNWTIRVNGRWEPRPYNVVAAEYKALPDARREFELRGGTGGGSGEKQADDFLKELDRRGHTGSRRRDFLRDYRRGAVKFGRSPGGKTVSVGA